LVQAEISVTVGFHPSIIGERKEYGLRHGEHARVDLFDLSREFWCACGHCITTRTGGSTAQHLPWTFGSFHTRAPQHAEECPLSGVIRKTFALVDPKRSLAI
jgi:hypothetical protein